MIGAYQYFIGNCIFPFCFVCTSYNQDWLVFSKYYITFLTNPFYLDQCKLNNRKKNVRDGGPDNVVLVINVFHREPYRPPFCGLSLPISSIKFMYQRDIVSKKAKSRNQYNQVPHLTQDTTWESDKNTRKRQIQESHGVGPFQAGDHKAAMTKQERLVLTFASRQPPNNIVATKH